MTDENDDACWENFSTCPDGFCGSCWSCRGECEEPGGPYPRDDGIRTPEEWRQLNVRNYILAEDGKTPIAVDDVLEWARWFENVGNRKVENTQAGEDVRVSTVFLGIDHNSHANGLPVLWETMIFGGDHDQWQDRYSSYDDAAAGHWRAVRIAKGEESAE